MLRQVNELDYDTDTNSLWGNVWYDHFLYQFDADTGVCIARLDLHEDQRLKGINKQLATGNAVWNGIALLPGKWLLFTGKEYPLLFLSKYK